MPLFLQVSDNLKMQYLAIKLPCQTMKNLHSYLPPLFRYLTESVPGSPPVQMVSLFDLHATLHLNRASLKHSQKYFNKDYDIPDLISWSNFDPSSMEMSILEGILDTEFEVAFISNKRGDELNLPCIPPVRFDALRFCVFDWLEESLSRIRSVAFFKEGRLPDGFVLQMIRAVSFLHSSGVRPFTLVRSFYGKFLDTLGTISLYRYAVTVLDPLLQGLEDRFAKRAPYLLQLCKKMNESLETWITSFEKELPGWFEVSPFRCFLLASNPFFRTMNCSAVPNFQVNEFLKTTRKPFYALCVNFLGGVPLLRTILS